MLELIQIVNSPINSNCFVVFDKLRNNKCLIVDPGSEDERKILDIVNIYDLRIDYIILTHEHFDHIWSVNAIMSKYPQIQLICSRVCGEMIVDKKKNCSLFYNQIGFELPQPSILTEEIDNQLNWNEYPLTFTNSCGHSDASICIQIEGNLFTGDTLIFDEKTVTKLPKGSKKKLHETINILQSLKGKSLTVRPGHGLSFFLDEYDLLKML